MACCGPRANQDHFLSSRTLAQTFESFFTLYPLAGPNWRTPDQSKFTTKLVNPGQPLPEVRRPGSFEAFRRRCHFGLVQYAGAVLEWPDSLADREPVHATSRTEFIRGDPCSGRNCCPVAPGRGGGGDADRPLQEIAEARGGRLRHRRMGHGGRLVGFSTIPFSMRPFWN